MQGKTLPPFVYLRAFEVVGRVGGVRKAALQLNIDHTVVSRHIQSLEEWLGVALFHRSSGKLTLTETGLRYHEKVAAAVLDLTAATADVLDTGDQRDIRVWCVPGFAAQWLSEQVAAFEAAWPGYKIELRPTDSVANLMLHEADVDIRFYGDVWGPPPGGKGLRHVELARPPILAVASPPFAERLKALEGVADLLDAPLLHEDHYEEWRTWFRLNGVDVETRLTGPLMWHAHLAIAAARQGRGVALASTYLVGQDLERGALVEIKPPGAKRVILGAYYFVSRDDRWNMPIIKHFRAFLQSRAG